MFWKSVVRSWFDEKLVESRFDTISLHFCRTSYLPTIWINESSRALFLAQLKDPCVGHGKKKIVIINQSTNKGRVKVYRVKDCNGAA